MYVVLSVLEAAVIVAPEKIDPKYCSGVCDASSGLGKRLKSIFIACDLAAVEVELVESNTKVRLFAVSCTVGAFRLLGYFSVNAGTVETDGEKAYVGSWMVVLAVAEACIAVLTGGWAGANTATVAGTPRINVL